MVKCFICGAGEDEVPKMHRFPTNINKSKIWQEKLGMRFMGENLRNYRICSKHFTLESYTDSINHRLLRDAVPMQFFNKSLASTSATPVEEVEESRFIVSESSNDMPIESDIPNIIESGMF
ncbi:uncharacterized protein LOC123307736 [Coccinella septempunctata]|uniref:uncharacterized protein LOC123307736 n=1 Tax=Coccinella septempunctata TaxID=41139 RepID=UPI001D0967D4|nr:uncharacterized protein LOC123307736 [Coccinella septempunctata]